MLSVSSRLLPAIHLLQESNKFVFVQAFDKAAGNLKELSLQYPTDVEVQIRRVEVTYHTLLLDNLCSELKKRLEQKSTFALQIAFALAELRSFEKSKKIKSYARVTDDMVYPTRTPEIPVSIQTCLKFIDKYPLEYGSWYVAGCAYEVQGFLPEAIMAWKKAWELCPSSLCILGTLGELQHLGALASDDADYLDHFEKLDPYVVHGNPETHKILFKEFYDKGEYSLAINALRTLSDWIQSEKGEVPPEIECLCLLGAHQCYKAQNNIPAAEACLMEVRGMMDGIHQDKEMLFIAYTLEEFSLEKEAQECFISLLKFPNVSLKVIEEVTTHCLHKDNIDELKEALKVTYHNTKGMEEVVFCQLLIDLTQHKKDVRQYMDRKKRLRRIFQRGLMDINALEESFKDTESDYEIHLMAAEWSMKQDKKEEALKHYEMMYGLHPLNSTCILKMVQNLVKTKNYSRCHEICKESLKVLTPAQASELSWLEATAYTLESKKEEALHCLKRSLEWDPWNISYICLYLKIKDKDSQIFLKKYIDQSIEQKPMAIDVFQGLKAYAQSLLLEGQNEWAYQLSKLLLLESFQDPETQDLFMNASSSYDVSLSVQNLLRMSKDFSDIAVIIAGIYALSVQWETCQEWCRLANTRSLEESRNLRRNLLKWESLYLIFQGNDWKRAQSLLEGALDSFEAPQYYPKDLTILLGYTLVVQGEIALGMEKLNFEEPASIFHYYFYTKALSRLGEVKIIKELQSFAPITPLDQKMLEEIYYLTGSQGKGGLMC